MNLTPRWVEPLVQAGFDAFHWTSVGAVDAPDVEIMRHAAADNMVVLTQDLDFGAILAASRGDRPSVVQIRADDTSPERIGAEVVRALRTAETELSKGALVTIEPGRRRLTLLPLGQWVGIVIRAAPMRVFTRLPMHDWNATAQAASDAEAASFDAVMTVELGHDVFAPLAIAALATQRVELTPSVAVAFPRSPTVLASQAWDLQTNSRGRFVLGLGSQVKGHNERRFGIAWTAPAPRLRDYVRALRAVWRCWETRGKLDFHSEHYTLTLMTPDFSPEPSGLPMVPVTLAAVGEAMLRVAGQVADGVRLHPLCSRRYLEEVCLPQIAIGRERGGRARENFDVHGGGFVVTGPDDATVAVGMEVVRRRIGFYGSTRTYMPILALHGLQDLGLKLHRMSVEGRWNEMAAQVTDDVVRIFAACGTYRHIAGAIEQRYGGVADSIDLEFPADAPPGLRREVLADIRRIPHRFAGFNTDW